MTLWRDEGILREHIMQVIPNLYQITFRAANVLLIVEDTLTVVDTGFNSTVPKVLEFVRSLHRSPEEVRLIILTHCHFDHAGGARQLKRLTGARLACHRADISDSGTPLPYPRPLQRTLELRPLANLRSQLAFSSSEVDIQLQGGELLEPLGGLRVVHTPGHTPGSICLISAREKLLIAGDTLVRQGRTIVVARKGVSTAPAQAARSVRALAAEDFDKICFGHRLPLTENAKRSVHELVARIRLKARRGRSPVESSRKGKAPSKKLAMLYKPATKYHN